MLGVVDESKGTGAGYDVAYIDENMNGDLADDTTRVFSRRENGSRVGELEPNIEFEGPFQGKENAKYAINISSLASRNSDYAKRDGHHFHWYLHTKEWFCFFMNGKMELYPTLDEALEGTPVLLGGECRWQISSRIRGRKSLISAGLKDINGCTLRSLRRNGQMVSPTLTLIKNGKVETEEKMKFG